MVHNWPIYKNQPNRKLKQPVTPLEVIIKESKTYSANFLHVVFMREGVMILEKKLAYGREYVYQI